MVQLNVLRRLAMAGLASCLFLVGTGQNVCADEEQSTVRDRSNSINRTLTGTVEVFSKARVPTTKLRGTTKIDKESTGGGQSNDENNRHESLITIQWDKWHNKVSRSIWSRLCVLLVGGDAIVLGNTILKLGDAPEHKFPLGTRATYECTINSNRRITGLRIVVPSGYSEFDEIVLASVRSIEGRRFVQFPPGSKRQDITISAELYMTKNGRFTEQYPGEIETYTSSSQ